MVAVEHIRLAVLTQGVLQAVHAKRGFDAVADSPAEHPPGVQVNHNHEVGKAPRPKHEGDVLAPDLIGPHHGHAAQQVVNRPGFRGGQLV